MQLKNKYLYCKKCNKITPQTFIVNESGGLKGHRCWICGNKT